MPAPKRAQTPDDWTRILDDRARKLAEPLTVSSTGVILNVVSFTLANETYAIETGFIVSAFKLASLTPLPGAPAPVFGLTVWRGDVLTVVDLRPVLGLPVAALNDLSRVLVLGTDRPVFGLVVDAVRVVTSIKESDIGPLPGAMTKNRRYVRGITPDAVLVLDGEPLVRLLKSPNDERGA